MRDESEPETSSETDAIVEARERERDEAAAKQKQKQLAAGAAYADANGMKQNGECVQNGGAAVNGKPSLVSNGTATTTNGNCKANGFNGPTHSNSC